MKQIVQKLWMVIAMLCISTYVFAYDFEIDGIYYNIISFSDLKCEVTHGENDYASEVVIPSQVSINSKILDVIKIGDYAFSSDSELVSVSIPSSVLEIGEHAFQGCNLVKRFELPSSIEKIGNYAFENCISLEYIKIPETVKSIGDEAFRNCGSLTEIQLPNSIGVLGAGAFKSCSSLNSIVLPESLNAIDGSVFMDCVKIKSINLPRSITKIGYSAFANCTNLGNIKMPESLTSIGGEAFLNCTSFTEMILPDKVTYVGEKAFAGCHALESIKLSNSMKRISAGLFKECTSLNDIEIPSSINEGVYYTCKTYYGSAEEGIGYSCFPPNLKKIKFDDCKWEFNMIEAFHRDKDVTSGKYTESPLSMSHWFYKSSTASFQDFSLLPIEDMYIGRSFPETRNGSDYEQILIPTIKNITLGENIVKCQINIKKSTELKTLTCHSKTPPTNISFTTQQKMNLIVRVPMDALPLYKETAEWKDLWNLEGFETDSSNIRDAIIDELNIEIGRYNLYGIPVNLEYKGVVIIQYSDGSVVKLLQR